MPSHTPMSVSDVIGGGSTSSAKTPQTANNKSATWGVIFMRPNETQDQRPLARARVVAD